LRIGVTLGCIVFGFALATPASAGGCQVTADGNFPGIHGLRATGADCVTANAVAQGIQDGWVRHQRFVSRVRTWDRPREEAGRRLTWRCRYVMKPESYDANGDWLPRYASARCTRMRAVVNIESLHS
jgi:hypothetical protein